MSVFLKKPVKKYLLMSCFIMLTGCANQPRKTEASLPLVAAYTETMPTNEKIPERYWETLGDASATTMTSSQYNIKLNPIYLSALGHKCRELEISNINHQMQKRVVCEFYFKNEQGKQDKAWFLEAPIVTVAYPVEL